MSDDAKRYLYEGLMFSSRIAHPNRFHPSSYFEMLGRHVEHKNVSGVLQYILLDGEHIVFGISCLEWNFRDKRKILLRHFKAEIDWCHMWLVKSDGVDVKLSEHLRTFLKQFGDWEHD
jgi:hypothetical protein